MITCSHSSASRPLLAHGIKSSHVTTSCGSVGAFETIGSVRASLCACMKSTKWGPAHRKETLPGLKLHRELLKRVTVKLWDTLSMLLSKQEAASLKPTDTLLPQMLCYITCCFPANAQHRRKANKQSIQMQVK